MLLRRTRKYYIDKVRIDKSVNQRTAYKIQLYNDYQVDELVKKYNEGETISKPAPSKLWADLAVLNKPEVYNNYNHIINSKYTSNDNLDNLIVKNLANKDLNRIVEAEVERISKNLDYAEQVMQKYEVPLTMYEEFKKEQSKNSISSRQQVLKDVAIKANDLLVSEGLNIPKVYTYRNIETTAENLLRQSQMGSKHQEILAINNNYKNQGKDEIYTGKEWIWTGRGKTTRHRSNHLQKRQLKEPFIIVNDKTLHIDELMYPSDPAGSFSNAWICYCECQYLTGDAKDYQYLGSLNLTDTKFKVNAPALKTPTFMTAKQFNKELNKPSPVKISQPVATNIQDYMNVNVGTSTSSLIDDSVDGVTSIPHNYLIDGSKVPVIYNAETGKYYYNGLELKEYDVQSQMGKVSKAAVTKHNNNIAESTTEPAQVTAGFIDVSELSKGYFGYDIFDFDGVEEINGKYYLKGLDITQYYNAEMGIAEEVPKELIKEHNKQFKSANDEEVVLQPQHENKLNDELVTGEPIDTNASTILYMEDDNVYFVTKPNLTQTNGKFYYKDLDVTDYMGSNNLYADIPKEVVDKHNEQFGVEPNTKHTSDIQINNEPINTTGFIYNSVKQEYTFFDSDINEVNGKKYVNGLDVTQYYDSHDGWADVPKQVIEDYNKQFENTQEEYSQAQYIDADNDPNITSIVKSYYIDGNGITYNESTGKYEYKGLELDKYKDGVGKVKKVKLEAHNKNVKKQQKFKKKLIDTFMLEEMGNDSYFVDGNLVEVVYNAETGKYYHNGLELDDYDPQFQSGSVKVSAVEAHNDKLQEVKPVTTGVLDNQYVNNMQDKINILKIGNEIHIEDKDTGVKYVYDEKADYEQAQDIEQGKVQFGEHETNSTQHWGRYGHQTLNGLMYSIEKYGYHHYAEDLEKALPLLNKIREMHKKQFRGLDVLGNPIYDDYDKIEIEINKLGNIIDNIKEPDMYAPDVDNIKDALWEIMYIDKTMIESPALRQNTFLVRFGHWSKDWCKIGDIVNLEGFSSTTYKSGSAKHFEEKMEENPNRWAILIMAEKGTSGTRLNNQFNALTSEREWLLPRDQDFEVVGFDVDNRTVLLRVKKHPLYN